MKRLFTTILLCAMAWMAVAQGFKNPVLPGFLQKRRLVLYDVG